MKNHGKPTAVHTFQSLGTAPARITGALLLIVLTVLGPYRALAGSNPPVSDCPVDETHLISDISSAGPGGTVIFTCTTQHDIPFSSTIALSQSVALVGSSSQTVIFDGANGTGSVSTPLFTVSSGVTFSATNLTFANAGATSGNGGAINNSGTTAITNSTFTQDTSGNSPGGAIYNGAGATLSLTNDTFSGNSAYNSQPGGAIYNAGTLTVTSSTLSGNSASSGGAIDNVAGASMTIGRTIIANSTGDNCTNAGTVTDNGYNLEDTSPSTCGFSAAKNDVIGSSPMLGSLQYNGGPTQTLAPASGSPAIDVVPTKLCQSADQRGAPRPDGGETTCDSGAFETGSAPPPISACPTTQTDLINDVNNAGVGGTVDFDCLVPTTIHFDTAHGGTGNYVYGGGVTLDGSHSAPVTFDGGSSTELFYAGTGDTWALIDLTFQNGSSPWGGAIENDGTVTIANCTFNDNAANHGGGAIDNEGTATITNSSFTFNIANGTSIGAGGAIYNDGTLSVAGSTFANNAASQTTGLGGGAIFTGDPNIGMSAASIRGSTFANNWTGSLPSFGWENGGGAIASRGSSLTITNSTFYGNSNVSRGGAGGAIFTGGASTNISASTFTGNSIVTTFLGGAIYYQADTGTSATIGQTIVAANTGGNCSSPNGPITDGGYNLEDTKIFDCGFVAKTDIFGNPNLGPLQIDGGPTETMLPLSGSPAIDAIPTSSNDCQTTGQRGYARPDDNENFCDIGAVESGQPPRGNRQTPTPTHSGNPTLTPSAVPGRNSRLTPTPVVSGTATPTPSPVPSRTPRP